MGHRRARAGRALLAVATSVALAAGLVPAAGPSPIISAGIPRAIRAPRPLGAGATAVRGAPLVEGPLRSPLGATVTAAVHGTIATADLPAPWGFGRVLLAHLDVYLPAGYAASGLRYPVVYAVPWNLRIWEAYGQVVRVLDQAVHAGLIPPEIVVFVDLSGGPYPTSECADSAGGLQRADSYVAHTVVHWVDQHLRTLDRPAARTLLGFSQGGFCAANLLLRHTDIFANAVAFDGYYLAGIRSAETATARFPWGNDPTLVAANSPLLTVDHVAPSTRNQLFLVLSANPNEPLYGPQATIFAARLALDGVPLQTLWSPLGHRWKAVRLLLPAALAAVAAHRLGRQDRRPDAGTGRPSP